MEEEISQTIEVENNWTDKIVYLGKVPKHRQIGELWTPLHTVTFILFIIGGLGLGIVAIMESLGI